MKLAQDQSLARWSRNEYLSSINDENSLFLVYEFENDIQGLIIFGISYDFMEIHQVIVNERNRNKGIASSLLLEGLSMNENKDVFLEVNEVNTKALSFYSKHGFEILSRRKNYYGSNDALVMRKVME
ncbi:GNAT family N-acetyltransferase [Erysipelothrix sp. HDW6A]|uniref:GNAT family N-acetyltransferase n=1 Tax=Erysipelothrix sp. HDW6A TaxID=2714928 RepID=UPI00140BBC33|nr:N-acetyltransferase [Erysipelothrix sp. HDW6A]QIK57678.1 GNAT family N-acetyltransferase [Erysipelothrix sp. HDW6A]